MARSFHEEPEIVLLGETDDSLNVGYAGHLNTIGRNTSGLTDGICDVGGLQKTPFITVLLPVPLLHAYGTRLVRAVETIRNINVGLEGATFGTAEA